MAYDEQLADRIRTVLGGASDIDERKMFGGLSFLVGGQMAVAASGHGGLLARVDPDDADMLVNSTSATPMEMNGRAIRGWLMVPADHVADDAVLRIWVERSVEFARALPPKGTRRRSPTSRPSKR